MARAAVQIARPLCKDPLAEPIIDARLADGSRVAICGPPAAPSAAITIRRFGGRAFTVADLTASGSLPPAVVDHTAAVLRSRRNVLISGGTGSGKTTLLNACSTMRAVARFPGFLPRRGPRPAAGRLRRSGEGRVGVTDLPRGNLVSALIELETNRERGRLPEKLGPLIDCCGSRATTSCDAGVPGVGGAGVAAAAVPRSRIRVAAAVGGGAHDASGTGARVDRGVG